MGEYAYYTYVMIAPAALALTSVSSSSNNCTSGGNDFTSHALFLPARGTLHAANKITISQSTRTYAGGAPQKANMKQKMRKSRGKCQYQENQPKLLQYSLQIGQN